MDRFRPGQRVIVTDRSHPLYEHRGKVLHLNTAGAGAVVAIEGGLPDEQSIVVDGELRSDRTILQPHQCRELR
jgi:hypothetical protein